LGVSQTRQLSTQLIAIFIFISSNGSEKKEQQTTTKNKLNKKLN